MKLWAVGIAKDESDILNYTLSHLLFSGVDGIVIADNNSSDRTSEIIQNHKKKALVEIKHVFDPVQGYFQSQKMTSLAKIAHECGAEAILPFDADELLHDNFGRNPIGVLKRNLEMQTTSGVVAMGWRNHYRTNFDKYIHKNPFLAMTYAEESHLPWVKVAFVWNDDFVIEQGNHAVRTTDGRPVVGNFSYDVEVRHFPYRSAKQFIRKVVNGGRAYEAAGDKIPEQYGHIWRGYYKAWQDGGDKALVKIYNDNFNKHLPGDKGMMYDPAKYLGEIAI